MIRFAEAIRATAVFYAVGVAAVAAIAAEPPSLRVPVRCPDDIDCLIQKYVDDDPGPDYVDYTCGKLSSPGHTGTDIRLPNLVAMRRGVAVVAAAPGRVAAVRDGIDDINVRDADPERIKGRGAGNVVLIDHGGGWRTIYAHLRKGSVAVAVGDRVEAGRHLGYIGLSGRTEFPHLHFEVRLNGQPRDPFVGEAPAQACGGSRAPLWREAALDALPYRASGLLSAGFAGTVPKARDARAGAYAKAELSNAAPVIGFWSDMFGILPGDRIWMRVTTPDGRVLAEKITDAVKGSAQEFRFIGARRGQRRSWPAGRYHGELELRRAGAVVFRGERWVTLHGVDAQ